MKLTKLRAQLQSGQWGAAWHTAIAEDTASSSDVATQYWWDHFQSADCPVELRLSGAWEFRARYTVLVHGRDAGFILLPETAVLRLRKKQQHLPFSFAMWTATQTLWEARAHPLSLVLVTKRMWLRSVWFSHLNSTNIIGPATRLLRDLGDSGGPVTEVRTRTIWTQDGPVVVEDY